MKASLVSVLSLVLCAQGSLLPDDSPAAKGCDALQQKYPKLVAKGLDPRYIKSNTGIPLSLPPFHKHHLCSRVANCEDFYTTSAVLNPKCVFEPTTSEEMAGGVQILRNVSSPFAFRGGGHMPIGDAANINSTGVLLSSYGLTQVDVADDGKTVNVGPGNHWVDVYRGLESHGLTVVGGRLGVVGVPGLLLGGGVSFFGNEYGWASANIASFTVCMP